MKQTKSLLTKRFDQALQFASRLHRTQKRKDTEIPDIAHLMSVDSIVLEAGGNENQAIAALLHDVVEDQGGLKTLAKIRRLFRKRVAQIVRECSDSESEDPDQKPSWHERKKAYLKHLRVASADAVLVSIADKLHNVRAILADYRALAMTFDKYSDRSTLVDEFDRIVSEIERLAKA